MDIKDGILIIQSHFTQGSQGPVGEPGIQVSYQTYLAQQMQLVDLEEIIH